jgi:hypothetical protein
VRNQRSESLCPSNRRWRKTPPRTWRSPSALAANTAILEKLEAGREAALAQLEQKAPTSPPARAARRPTSLPRETLRRPGVNRRPLPLLRLRPTAVSEDDLRKADRRLHQGRGRESRGAQGGARGRHQVDHRPFRHRGARRRQRHQGRRSAAQALFYLKRFAAGRGRFLCRIRFRRGSRPGWCRPKPTPSSTASANPKSLN